MLLDMAGRRLILMLCTILLVLIKCIDTQNDNQSSPHASTTATLTPTPVTHSNSAGLEKSENVIYSNASTSHPASTTPSKPALKPSTTPASSATASSPPTSHPLTTYIPLIPTTVTHATDAQNASSPPNSHPLTTSIPLNPTTVTHATGNVLSCDL
ncbi:uncharacterized protein LOC135253137 isoform X2 [Anguilla rostrata]|uniref:uncharacterized protein LOC135253137 isoform X2 n=1 Tax=Anguilla rostrata TaxID=7938 RepID=UPI0030CE7132